MPPGDEIGMPVRGFKHASACCKRGSIPKTNLSFARTCPRMPTLTIRIDDKLDSELRELVARTGKRKSEFAREALRRQLALERFNDLRQRLAPFAEAHGWLTDEEVFAEVS